jgi:hypothetical protein
MCGYSKINLGIILNGYVFLPTLFIFSQEYYMLFSYQTVYIM